jgi:hypothetical protein
MDNVFPTQKNICQYKLYYLSSLNHSGESMASPEAAQEKPKRLISPIIVLVLAIIFLLWLMLLFMDKTIYEEYGMELEREMWIYIGSFIMILFIIVLLVTGFPARTPAAQAAAAPAQFTTVQQTPVAQPQGGVVVTSAQPLQPEGGMAVVEAEPLVVEAEVIEAEPIEEEEEAPPKGLKMKKARLVEYPKKVPGGVYGDTIVRVDPRTKLNLRTLLVRSCMICDRQGKCWEEIQDSIPRDDFLSNIECKRGLRKLRSHRGEGEAPRRLKKKKLVMKVKPKEELDTSGL